MRVLTKYRLELRWDKVEYSREAVAVLKGAYFTGPVLKDAAQLEDEDQLILDMTAQHIIFVIPEYYQATLKWKGVEYKDDKIFLKESWIEGKYINSVETLEDNDFILIDCREHEKEKHPFLLVYWAEVCKEDKEKKY